MRNGWTDTSNSTVNEGVARQVEQTLEPDQRRAASGAHKMVRMDSLHSSLTSNQEVADLNVCMERHWANERR